MNQKSTWIVFATILVATGMIGGYGLSKAFPVATDSVKPMTSTGFITGHIELVAKDKDGNIKAYRQTDNLITNKGQNCAAKALFSVLSAATTGGSNSSIICSGPVTQPFTAIAIGTSTAPASKENYKLVSEVGTGLGLDRGRVDIAIVWANATTKTTVNGDFAEAVLQKTFTLSSGSATITESGLFNDTVRDAGAMFARQAFTGISLTTVGDALTVKWTIDIGGNTGALS